jgi:type I restriction-modification system DNA methylase subunit
MELSEADKPLIVSGILLALMDTSFEASFSATTNNDDLADNLVKAIEHTLKKNRVKDQKITAMIPGYTFIQTNKAVKAFLPETIKKIHENLFFTLQPNKSIDILGSFDLLGSFYGEFLRYSGGDQQGLGIVLTPRHITELFADMARLNPEKSVVLDPCAGTGGFLIASMANMVQHTGNDSEIIKRIKNEGLVGIELDQHMFTLSCANMIFRGDGKSNMFWDDCLAPDNETKMHISELKPNVAMLNPPYSKKAKGKHELVFVKQALDLLKDSGYCFAIVPVGALIGEQKETVRLKKDIMAKHRLHAVMSMPAQLFPGVGAVTAIVVLEANRPHCRSEKQPVFDDNGNQMFDGNGKPVMKTTNIPISETWFGYWRDDGLRLNKNRRTERTPGLWEEIKEEWLDAYFNQREVSGRSCKKAVTHVDEWLAEAYMETDYSALTQEDFNREIKKFLLYNLMLDIQGGDEEEDVNDEA